MSENNKKKREIKFLKIEAKKLLLQIKVYFNKLKKKK